MNEYNWKKSDHENRICQAMACMNQELSEAVITAIEAENPVDGYREAVEIIEDTFEDFDAATIEELFKTSVLRILRARVEGLMSDAKRRGSSDNGGRGETDSRGKGDLKNTGFISGCGSADYFVCEYTGVL